METKSRFDIGLEKITEVGGEAGKKVLDSLKDICPDLGKYIIEFAFGDIYSRKELDLKQRELVTITSIVTLGGCEKELYAHINGGLNVGLRPEEIIEVILQCAVYAGFPRSVSAMNVAKVVFEEKKITIKK